MTLQIDFWQLLGLLLAFFSACAAAGKFMLLQSQRHIDQRTSLQDRMLATNHAQVSQRLDGIEACSREEASQWQRVERELMSLKADLPLQYVRREDYIRGQSVIEAKLDGLAVKLENAQLRSAMKGATYAD